MSAVAENYVALAEDAEKRGLPMLANEFRRKGGIPEVPAPPAPAEVAWQKLKDEVESAKRVLDYDRAAIEAADKSAKQMVADARASAEQVQADARNRVELSRLKYNEVVASYADVCKKAGRECDYSAIGKRGGAPRAPRSAAQPGGRTPRGENVGDVVHVDVTVDGGSLSIEVRSRPDTKERHAIKDIRQAITDKTLNKIATAYIEKYVGKKEVVGNKAGTLYNKIKAKVR